MGDVHGVADLPASTAPDGSDRAANLVVPDYFDGYERWHHLPVVRPVQVDRVESEGDLLVVRAGDRVWRTRTLVNATGTWTRPFVPHYPGIASFVGEQLHTAATRAPSTSAASACSSSAAAPPRCSSSASSPPSPTRCG